MTLITYPIRPGLMVGLTVSTKGNVKYERTELVDDHILEDGSREAEWNTKRTVDDAAEQERAEKARSKCRSLIRSVCIQSGRSGLLCLQKNRAQLSAAIEEARAVADTFNLTAERTEVQFTIMIGEVKSSDDEAMRAIGTEITGLLDGMQQGVEALDVDQIRDAANRARSLAQMLEPGVADRVEAAIEAARDVAKDVRKSERDKVGDGSQRDAVAVRAIATARQVFLDLEEAVTVTAPVAQSAQLDLEV